MEVISLHVEVISRRKGRSAVQMAAYCSRSKIYSEYVGKTYDYSKRQYLVYHAVLIPGFAPNAFRNSGVLWNSVEQIEKSRNARLARSLIIALPKELGHDQQIEMACQYAQATFVERGMCADLSIHDKGDGNPHLHILLTTRSLDGAGQWMGKQRKNYLLDSNGCKLRDPISNKYLLGKSIKVNDWDELERIEEWRKAWADICNVMFEKSGIDKEVTYISYVRQGIDREPTKHLGAKVSALKKRGIMTDRGLVNCEISERNYNRERLKFRNEMERDYDLDILR